LLLVGKLCNVRVDLRFVAWRRRGEGARRSSSRWWRGRGVPAWGRRWWCRHVDDGICLLAIM
jgi:hypothetical protein